MIARRTCPIHKLRAALSIAFLSAVLAGSAFSQSFWTNTYGGAGSDVGEAVRQTDDGGYVVAGWGDPSGGVSFFENFLLVKTDASGQTEWSRHYGRSPGGDRAYDVERTSDGGYIVVGVTNLGGPDPDAWLVKTDALGDTLWTRVYGTTGNFEDARAVQQTSDGGYVFAGNNGSNSGDAWVVKTDANGDETWTRVFGGFSPDWAWDVLETTDGGFVFAGTTSSFGAGGSDYWLLKMDAAGNELWAKYHGGTGGEDARSLRQTTDGGFVIAGYSQSFADPTRSRDFWLVKTDANGDSLWTRSYGVNSVNWPYGVEQTQDGGYAMAGWTWPSTLDGGDDDVWLVKTDASGEVMWTTLYPGSSDDAHDLRQTSDGGYIMVGTRNDTGVGQDFLVIKTDPEGRSVSSVGRPDQDVLPSGYRLSQNYPNPFNPVTTVDYSQPTPASVVLRIFDVLGREVSTIPVGEKGAGRFRISVDAKALPSGTYFYRIEAGEFVETRTMVVLK